MSGFTNKFDWLFYKSYNKLPESYDQRKTEQHWYSVGKHNFLPSCINHVDDNYDDFDAKFYCQQYLDYTFKQQDNKIYLRDYIVNGKSIGRSPNFSKFLDNQNKSYEFKNVKHHVSKNFSKININMLVKINNFSQFEKLYRSIKKQSYHNVIIYLYNLDNLSNDVKSKLSNEKGIKLIKKTYDLISIKGWCLPMTTNHIFLNKDSLKFIVANLGQISNNKYVSLKVFGSKNIICFNSSVNSFKQYQYYYKENIFSRLNLVNVKDNLIGWGVDMYPFYLPINKKLLLWKTLYYCLFLTKLSTNRKIKKEINFYSTKYPCLFHKYLLNTNKNYKKIPYTVMKYSVSNKKYPCHIHCYDLKDYSYMFQKYLNHLSKFFFIILTYNESSGIDLIYSLRADIILEIPNYGMDVGSKFSSCQFLKDYNISYNNILFLHSKTEKKKRDLLIDSFLHHLEYIVSQLNNSDLGGYFPPYPVCENGWGRNSIYMNEFLSYLDSSYRGNYFIAGNMYILNKKVTDILFSDLNIYNILNTPKSFDFNWFTKKYKIKSDYNIKSLYQTYSLYNNRNFYGNCLLDPKRECRDGMIEHCFERLILVIIHKLNLRYFIINKDEYGYNINKFYHARTIKACVRDITVDKFKIICFDIKDKCNFLMDYYKSIDKYNVLSGDKFQSNLDISDVIICDLDINKVSRYLNHIHCFQKLIMFIKFETSQLELLSKLLHLKLQIKPLQLEILTNNINHYNLVVKFFNIPIYYLYSMIKLDLINFKIKNPYSISCFSKNENFSQLVKKIIYDLKKKERIYSLSFIDNLSDSLDTGIFLFQKDCVQVGECLMRGIYPIILENPSNLDKNYPEIHYVNDYDDLLREIILLKDKNIFNQKLNEGIVYAKKNLSDYILGSKYQQLID